MTSFCIFQYSILFTSDHYYQPNNLFVICLQKSVTPLHWAIENKNQEMARWLVTLGSDIHKADNVRDIEYTDV